MEDFVLNVKQIRKNGASLNNRINSAISGKPDSLYDAASHMISKGGKRLPYMAVKSCTMLGGKKSDATPAAIAMMIHNFTLVHDDIMDNDEIRHGIPTVHKKYGLPFAILAGDVLFSSKLLRLLQALEFHRKYLKACSAKSTHVCESDNLILHGKRQKNSIKMNEYTNQCSISAFSEPISLYDM